MTDQAFASQTDTTRPLLFLQGAVTHDLPGTFERAFGVSFFAYRAELQRIARGSLEAVDGATLTIGFGDFDDWFHRDDDEVVFPIDDDDVFAPDLADLVKRFDDETAMVVWSHVMAGFVDFKTRPAVARQILPILFSNNWGVRKSFLRQLGVTRAKSFLAHHNIAQVEAARLLGVTAAHVPRTFARRFASFVHPRVALVGDCYGVDFMHAGSLQLFGSLVSNGPPAEALGTFPARLRITVPDFIGWAQPLLDDLTTTIPRLANPSKDSV